MLLRKKWTHWSSSTSTLSKLITASLSVGMVFSPQALAEDGCSRDPNRMSVVVQLTSSGQQKLSRVAYEATRRNMDSLMKFIPTDIAPFGADPKICKRPNIEHLSPEKVKTDCFGILPEPLWDGDNQNASMDRIEPVQMKMSNLKVKHLALSKNPTIKCQNNVCDVTAGVEQFDMGFDMSAKSVNESCDKIQLKDVSVGVSAQAARNKPTKVHLKFRYTNDVSNPVEIIWDDSQIVVPKEAVKFQATATGQSRNLCKNSEDLQDIAPKAINHFVAKNQFVMNQIIDVVKTNALKTVADEQIKQLAAANGMGKDMSINAVVPSIKEITSDGALKGATQDQVNQADQYLDSIMAARSTADLYNALSSHSSALSVADYLSSFRSSKSATTVDMVQALSDKWKDNSKQISHLEATSTDPETKAMLHQENAKIKDVVSNLDQFRKKVKIDLDSKDDADQFALVVAALKADAIKSEIEAKVNACYRCRSFSVPGNVGQDWGFDGGPHDVAVKTGYGTLNQFLAIMQSKHGLDTCVIQDAHRDCKDARPEDVKIDVHFTNSPEVFWDAESNSFAIRVKQIQLNNQNGDLGRLASKVVADVVLPGRLTVDSDTKTIHFEPIQDKIKISNPQLTAAAWGDRWRILSGTVAWAIEKALNTSQGQGIAQSHIQTALTIDLPMPDQATLTQVKTGPQGFSVYFNLPENPLDLLPPETPARALAGSKAKLK